MKVYVVRYYDEIADSWEIDKVFGTEEKADEYCEEAIKNCPELDIHWIEYEVE